MALKSLSDHQTNPLDVNAGVDSTSNRIIKVPYVKRTPYGCATRSGFLAVLSGMAGALWAGGVLVLLVGCGVKAVPKGVPFGLDRIPTQKRVSPTEGWKDKGVRLAEEKQYNEAVEAFRNYVVEAPTDFFGFNALAVCYKNMGDHSQAMQNFERALELADSSEEKAKIMANIGNLYFSAEKPQAALGYYKEAAAENEKNPLYLVLVARAFAVLEEYDRAKKVLAHAETMEHLLDKYEREEDRGLASYLMAYSYAALDEEDKVLKYIKRALKVNPKKYVPKIRKDLSDERSLLYTLKEHPKIGQMIRSFTIEDFLVSSFKK